MTKDMKLSELVAMRDALKDWANTIPNGPWAGEIRRMANGMSPREFFALRDALARHSPTALRDSTDRDAVLEEAAKVADNRYRGHGAALGTRRSRNYEHAGKSIAEAIRALKSSPTNPSEGREG